MVAKFSTFDPCGGPGCTSGAILKKLSLITDFRLLSPSYKNQSIDLPRKLIAWFVYRKAVFHGETKYYDAPFYIRGFRVPRLKQGFCRTAAVKYFNIFAGKVYEGILFY